MFSACAGLKELNLYYCEKITGERRARRFGDLAVRKTIALSRPGDIAVFSACAGLKVLDLYDDRKITGNTARLKEQLPQCRIYR